MRINIDHLTESELVDLNQRVVQRLRMIHQMHAHVRMLEFKIGERVWFQTDRRMMDGTLIRYNKKSVTVVTDAGERWTVSPGFLRKSPQGSSAHGRGVLIEADRIDADSNSSSANFRR
jgi:hypothetical protein